MAMQREQPPQDADVPSIQLQPFLHQVSGSCGLLCFDDSTVCKPFIKREHCFYETMPEEMEPFVPQFRGVVEVTVEQDCKGCLSLMAHPSRQTLEKYGLLPGGGTALAQVQDLAPKTATSRLCLAESTHVDAFSFKLQPDSHQQRQQKELHAIGRSSQGHDIHPWVEYSLQRQLARMSKSCEHSNGRHNFMLLENVAMRFKQPSVLDFKMGTTTVGPDHSEEEKRRVQERCRTTTSARLGFRLSGMQVYQADTGQYICCNKYHGRKVTAASITKELTQYLHNGRRLRTELIELIVQRLQDLHAMVSRQDTFRFSSSSLLIMYEGEEVGSGRVCDGAWDCGPYPDIHSDAETILEKSEHSQHSVVDDVEHDDGNKDSLQALEDLQHQLRKYVHGVGVASGSKNGKSTIRVNGRPQPVVDIRVIDFGRSTHRDLGLGDSVHTGPDQDLHPLPSIPPPPDPKLPPGMPAVAWNPWTDIRSREDVQKLNISFPYGPVPGHFELLIRQSYYAATTYIDDLVGHLLDGLDRLGLANSTLVTFIGDHGWSLGEHQEWAKYSVFEVATSVPLLVYVPGVTFPKQQHIGQTFPYIDPFKVKSRGHGKAQTGKCNEMPTVLSDGNCSWTQGKDCTTKDSEGQVKLKCPTAKHETDALVELVDLFPSLAELAGLQIPPLCPVNSSDIMLCTEGTSFAPLIHSITNALKNCNTNTTWKKAAFSQYPRPSFYPQENSDKPDLADITIMGYTMWTQWYRYTEWVKFNPGRFSGDFSSVYARELYIHTWDPFEDVNVAYEAKYENLRKEASQLLQKGWRDALPSVCVHEITS